jgi:DNA-binding Xre family transcriptional regulator
MIKTDTQLARTIDDIKRFHEQLQGCQLIDDALEKQLVCDSIQGMIHGLLLEVTKYREAKEGRVHIPARLKSIHELCPYLTSIRIALGWSQENLAHQVGVTRQAVNKWEEHDYRGLDADDLDRVVGALGVHTLISIEHDTVELTRMAKNFDFERELAAAVA